MKIIDVTPQNVREETFFCIKNVNAPEFKAKEEWFNKRFDEGLRINILKSDDNKPIAFIEYIPANFAWRPVIADNYMFIHCMYTYSNKDKGKGYASELITACEEDAKHRKMDGVAVMTSKGSWIANKSIFEKLNYVEFDKRGRFELMAKKFHDSAKDPKLIDWTANLSKYKGWHLLYSDQCPWHGKSVEAICNIAKENNIDIQLKKLTNSEEAKQMPSGFGVFNLIFNGKLLEDHYISGTRFKNILKKEIK